MTRHRKSIAKQGGDLSWVDHELHEFFRQYEGRESPRIQPRNSRVRLLVTAFTAIVLVAVISAVVVRTTDNPGATGSQGTGEAACAAVIEFHDVRYEGQKLPSNASLEPGQTLGDGTLPPCNDTVVPGQPPDTAADEVGIVSLRGIDPSVAVALAGQEDTIYVATGRCARFDKWADRLQCLREPLMFGGRMYVATSLRGKRLPVGGVIGSGRAGMRELLVRRIASVSETLAVTTTDGSVVYLSSEGCYLSAVQDLIRCLTAGKSH